jgi:hypothetical protein
MQQITMPLLVELQILELTEDMPANIGDYCWFAENNKELIHL